MTDNDTASVSESRNNAKSPINNNNNSNNQQCEVETDAREEPVQDQRSRIDTSSQGKAGNQATEAVTVEEPSMADGVESENSLQQDEDTIVNDGDAGAVDNPSPNSETSAEVQDEEFVEFQINDSQSSRPEGINHKHRPKCYFFYVFRIVTN
jgi:hypothetical protein